MHLQLCYLIALFYYHLFFSFHCHHQIDAMTRSSKMNCSAIHVSLQIVKCCQALIDTTNNKSPAVLKKKCSDSSKCKKGGGGPKSPVGAVPPPPSPPSKEVNTTINKGWLLLLLCFLSFLTSFYLIVLFVLVTHEIPLC